MFTSLVCDWGDHSNLPKSPVGTIGIIWDGKYQAAVLCKHIVIFFKHVALFLLFACFGF